MTSARQALCGVITALACVSPRASAKSGSTAEPHAARAERLLPAAPHHDGKAGERPGKRGLSRKTKHALPPPRPDRPVRALPPNATWKKYRSPPWRRGFVTLVGHGKKWSGYVVDRYGDVIPGGKSSLASVLASWRTGKQISIDDRLIRLIADVSDEFGGRPIRIVSGYREHSYAPDSRHKTGEAFDFSIPEVPNESVRDFLRSLPDVGVGYYPNSTHVHLDVREKPTYWVDYSRPGDRPVYAWDRRVSGLTAGERLLAAALESIASHARGEEGEAPLPGAALPALAPPRAVAEAPRAPVASATDRDAAEDEREEDGGEPGVDGVRLPPRAALSPRAPAAAAFSDATDPSAR